MKDQFSIRPSAFRPSLPAATSRVLSVASRGPIARAAAKMLVAGADTADAVRASQTARAAGHEVAWLPLAAVAHTPDDLVATKDAYLTALDELAQFSDDAPADLTIDLATFGVLSHDVRPELLLGSLRELGQRARNRGVTLTLTISEPAVIEAVYVIAQELRQDFPEVGLVFPTRLRRGSEDVVEQARPGHRVRLTTARLDAAIGMTSARESGNAFVDAAKQLLQADAVVGFETDDVLLLDIAASLTKRYEASAEVVAPLGTVTLRQEALAADGLRTRIVIPYGPAADDYVAATMAAHPSLALSLSNPLKRRSRG